MKILLTGGSGDLASAVVPTFLEKGDDVVLLDVREPACLRTTENAGSLKFLLGSILDREELGSYVAGCDVIVHIAAWHGIHEFKNEKDAYDFFDLNIRGAFEIFEAAVRSNISKIVFISSTSVDEPNTVYGQSKVIAEQLAEFYARHHDMSIITLRPRAFIPPWNRAVYADYIEWARWFWKGAVHINDVAQSVVKSIEFLTNNEWRGHAILTVDGAYEYTEQDLANWDSDGPGSTFRKYYNEFYDLAVQRGLHPEQKPKRLDISATRSMIGYEPKFSLMTLLQELNLL